MARLGVWRRGGLLFENMHKTGCYFQEKVVSTTEISEEVF
jgi:hypothetical protein